MKRLTCAERDSILLDPETKRPASSWGIYSSLTDAHGEFGDPLIETTWERDGVRIRDVRHPHEGQYSPPDRKPCEHWKYEVSEHDHDV